MENGIYVSLSAQAARIERLTTIAQNIANAKTVGFRASEIRFEELVKDISGEDLSFSVDGVEYLDNTQGGLEQTGNPLDFAVRGNAWFGVQTPAGPVVTRDGRFTMTPDGGLVTVSGYPVLDPGGAPIQLDPAAGEPEVGGDGFIRQGGQQVGAIGLFAFQPAPDFRRFGDAGIIVDGELEPIVDDPNAGVVQGYVEQSNVNALHEITQLIEVQRSFEQAAALMEKSEQSIEQLIRAFQSG
ncbi:flagellar basal-body rod protein FlgF [Oricola thermophila]|uniref:Flagellar basal-body rod protein FlgF n=1 Tax=Oricola thermophila TaxID=2742145 RepID=A0A6N1VFB8_9HYPH|nr:flagellar basal-body rod protein FlgF [Oricola thermophila]QKV19650.1 flagellar basal-body rod protein FlgF [Oricola thermophila]